MIPRKNVAVNSAGSEYIAVCIKVKKGTQSTLISRTEPIFCANVNGKSILKNCFLGFWQARENNSPLAAKLFLNPIRFSSWVRHNVDFL